MNGQVARAVESRPKPGRRPGRSRQAAGSRRSNSARAPAIRSAILLERGPVRLAGGESRDGVERDHELGGLESGDPALGEPRPALLELEWPES